MDFMVFVSQRYVLKINGRIDQKIERFLWSLVLWIHLRIRLRIVVKIGLQASIHRGDLGFEGKNRGNRLKTSEWTVSLVGENVGVWSSKLVTKK